MTFLSLLLGLLVILAITAATAYFVAQEFAYMTVDRSRLGDDRDLLFAGTLAQLVRVRPPVSRTGLSLIQEGAKSKV